MNENIVVSSLAEENNNLESLFVVKIGGNVIDNSENLTKFLKDFTAIEGAKILVHGGGKLATQLSDTLGVETKLIDGRRITDIETLRVVTMVYGGLINKNIVAQMQAFGNNAIGLTGADGNFIRTKKRPVTTIDYGYVGDIDEKSIDAEALNKLMLAGFVPVFCAITHDGKGQLLNTNADTIASALAVALADSYKTTLVYCFEKNGVLKNTDDDDSLIKEIDLAYYEELKSKKIIHSGMIPKLDNAFKAITSGVNAVIIGKSDNLGALKNNLPFGTRLTKQI